LLNIAIANINFIIYSYHIPILAEPSSPSYTPFLTKTPLTVHGSSAIDVILETEKIPSTGGMTEIFENCGSWSMLKSGDEYNLMLNPSLPNGPESVVRFKPRFEKAIVYCGSMNIVEIDGNKFIRNPFTYPLDQLLLMYSLADRQGALIHACGVEYSSGGYLFSGRSGAGKSTLSRKFASRGNEVLSDDRIVARKINGDFKIFGTPWSGEAGIAKNRNLPLRGIFFIHQDSKNFIKAITPAKAVEQLMPVTSIPWYDKEAMSGILSFCEDMVLKVPAYDLHFTPGGEIVDVLEKFVSG
jgi:hypothetical protein